MGSIGCKNKRNMLISKLINRRTVRKDTGKEPKG